MSEGTDIVHEMDARVKSKRAFKDRKSNTRQVIQRLRRLFGCFSSQRDYKHSRSRLPFPWEEETNYESICEIPLKPRTSESGDQTSGKLHQTVPRQTVVEVNFPSQSLTSDISTQTEEGADEAPLLLILAEGILPSRSLTSDISTQTEEGADEAPPRPILAEGILLSKSLASDISTHTEDGADKAPPSRNLAEVSLHPIVEIPVETIRAVGKSPSITFLDDAAIEALPAVLPSKTDDAAAADELPSDETMNESETVVKTTCNELRPKENEVREICENEDFPTTSALGMTNNNDHLGNIEQLSLQEHERDTSILREPISTQSLSPTSDSSPNELYGPSSIRQRFLSLKETEALIEMQNNTGKFSYYILNNGRVIVYPEDEKAKQNQALLKSSFMTTTRNEFDVIVKNSSFDGTFCTHRVGAKMFADRQPATVGMYFSYDGVLYFISSAHNFVLFTCTTNLQSIDRRDILHDGKRAQFDVMGTQAPIAPLYYIFSNTTSLESRGQKIMHTADIAVGQAPIFTHLITKGIQQFSSSLQEGQDLCRDCNKALEECVGRQH